MTRNITKNCSVCAVEFAPRHSLQHVCSSSVCKRENSRRRMNAWNRETGRVKGAANCKENWWTDEEIKVLENNRFSSNQELVDMLGRSLHSVKEKRSRLKLPQLAKCDSCDGVFQRINQHDLCLDCVPDQQGAAKDYRNSLNGRWQMYKSNAKKRDIPFDISIGDMADFWKKPCVYCGGEIETVGIDRIDNSKGYVEGNILSCCARCNEMKNAATLTDWLDQMEKVLRNMGKIK